ncbi:hypothetical protein ACU4GD_31755 [Cupriavidus basilensis]
MTSIGAVVAGDARPGASIVMQAGLGAHGADYAGFVQRYLDPSNQAESGKPLADQPGKVVHVYNRKLTLADWLRAGTRLHGRGQGGAGLPRHAPGQARRRSRSAQTPAGQRLPAGRSVASGELAGDPLRLRRFGRRPGVLQLPARSRRHRIYSRSV